jgi:hypothetical protein
MKANDARTANFFRVSNDFAIPKHWAYGEAWNLDEQITQTSETECEVEYVLQDYREDGCQGWTELATAIAATVWHQDGYYGPKDYAFLLLVAGKTTSGTSWWDTCDFAKRLWAVELNKIHAWLSEQADCLEDGELECGRVQDWVEAHEKQVRARLAAIAVEHPVKLIETLPCPKSYRKYLHTLEK